MTEGTPVVVFLGPSAPVSEARQILDADYRPPVRRGDLEDIVSGTVVAMIDGVFEHDLAVSPQEVQDAVNRGVVIFGGSSMGALRAVEVPGVIGVGRVFEWYRDEIITRDDEVALLFDPVSSRALTVPTVNVRFAVERLRSLGTIDSNTGNALISAAMEIPFKQRSYKTILKAAGLGEHGDGSDLMEMLQSYDIKHIDAQATLEAVDRYVPGLARLAESGLEIDKSSIFQTPETLTKKHCPPEDEVLIWESGDRATVDELQDFLGYTGKLEFHARAAFSRLTPSADGLQAEDHGVTDAHAQRILTSAAGRWGWLSSEEAIMTFRDLGLDQSEVGEQCLQEALAETLTAELIRERDPAFQRALQAELFLDDMALKRETMRLGSLKYFARQAEDPATPEECNEAQKVLCKVNGQYHFNALCNHWDRFGLSDKDAQVAFVELLARARRAGRELASAMSGQPPLISKPIITNIKAFELGPRPKPEGETRFCLPVADAEAHARRLCEIIGVTRIGMIGELADLDGVQIAQAARPGNAWSSSYGSGKSRSKEGAVVGSIMEELEKWAQEKFQPDQDMIEGRFRDFCADDRFIDPVTLDLPFDTVYSDEVPLKWHRCFDILGGCEAYIPIDPLLIGRVKHDLYYTRRGARKHMATNGLGSGFSREEAVLHGLCEYVERHSQRLAELLLANPGKLGEPPYRFVDLSTASYAVRDLEARLGRNNDIVRVLDITSEMQIPTFVATITRDMQRSDGYGTHPDPNTAIEMALLEAAQTIASATAGGREDLTIRARSLGRHERPRPVSVRDAWFWMDPDPAYVSLDRIYGLTSSDVYEDLSWCLERIRAAGVSQVVVIDLTPAGIEPAHVVRVIVPGLETNNPFFTGPRARLTLLRDLLPRPLEHRSAK